MESLLMVPRVKVAGRLTVHALDSLPIPILLILFLACFSLFQFQPSSKEEPLLPTSVDYGKGWRPTRLVPVPVTRPGQFVYLDTAARKLVASPTPLIPGPHAAKKERRPRPNKLKAILRAYRSPLSVVPEDMPLEDLVAGV